MTPEFWAIVGVGVSLFVFGVAALQFTFRRMDQRFADTNKHIAQHFDAVDKRIDETCKLIEQPFNDVGKRIDDTNASFAEVNRRMDGISSDVQQLTARVTELEKGQVGVEALLNVLREALFERIREGVGTPSD